ncbi:MAG: 50S ribosomal protein L6 [Pseudomonadota bacterium]
MSRAGRYPVMLPQGVSIELADGYCNIKGKLGELQVPRLEHAKLELDEHKIIVGACSKIKRAIQAWGTQRALLANAVKGVSEGFIRRLEINGVGYRAQIENKQLRLQLGFSHNITVEIPADLKVAIEGERGNIIAVSGISKQRVGQFASNIRAYRLPEPYKGKGVKYLEERIVRKEGKKK